MKTYTVKRLRLLQYLVERGFKDYTIIPDPTSTKKYNWFVFELTEDLEATVAEYFASKTK